MLLSPWRSISSRPMTILLAVVSRRCWVSLSRPLVTSTRPMSVVGALEDGGGAAVWAMAVVAIKAHHPA